MSLHSPRWTTPSESSSKIVLRPGTTAPRFQPPRFRSSFAENLKDWLRSSPRGAQGSKPTILAANWQARSENFWQSQTVALGIYSGIVLLLLLPVSKPQANGGETPAYRTTELFSDLSDYMRKLPPGTDIPRGGGGGGKGSVLPVTTGMAPKFKAIQLAPPSLPHDAPASLIAEASLLGDPAIQFPAPNLDRFGNPLAGLVNDSDGQGRGGGMGDGSGTGDGNGIGPGLGPGRNGGWGGDTFRAGHNGVGFPECVYCPDAKYSEDARKAKFQGVVLLQIVVSPDGRATRIEVVSGPGLGLEEEAVEAVKTWRFKPAFGLNRKPVAAQIAIEVQFRLL
jgi:TonB family protein